MADQNLALPRADLVEYVNTMLNEGTPFKQIARSLQITDPRHLKRMLSKALGYKFQGYHHFTTLEMSNTIKGALPNREHGALPIREHGALPIREHGALPIREHGANWGIWHVRAALARLQIRAPRRMVARALQIVSEAHYNRQGKHCPLFNDNIMLQFPWPCGILIHMIN